MNRYGKRCVLYPRVSTEMQVDGYSLEGQKNMLTRFADREEMIVVDTYEDAGKSGKSIEGRPAFQKMLRDIEDGLDIDYILVYIADILPLSTQRKSAEITTASSLMVMWSASITSAFQRQYRFHMRLVAKNTVITCSLVMPREQRN